MNSDSTPDRQAPRPRERLKEATSDAMLAAAEQVFAAQGHDAARMEAIAAAGAVPLGTLYNYFEARSALSAALLELRRTELIERLDSTLDESEDSAFEGELESLFRTLFEHFEEHRPFFSIVLAGEHVPDSKTSVASSRDTMKALYTRVER